MISEQNIQELLSYQPNMPVISVYINTNPVDGTPEFHRLNLRSLLKEAGLIESANDVIQFVEHEHDWSGNSLALFSCPANHFFRAYSLAIPIRSRVRLSDRPYVKPLADLLDSYGGYGVVLVDKQSARIFYFHLGELQEEQGVFGAHVRRTKRGGGSQSPRRRGGTAGQTDYVEELAEKNMREVVDQVVHFFSENKVRRIVLGGTDDNISIFRGLLPKAWQSLIVGSFAISMMASENDVLQKAMVIGNQAEKMRENRLAQAVVTSSAKGRGGVIGLQKTLDALGEGRVQTLLLVDGYREAGMQCTRCNYISVQPLEACSYCGQTMERISDVVELAVRRVMGAGGEVEVLHEDQKIEGFDKIGAFLRY